MKKAPLSEAWAAKSHNPARVDVFKIQKLLLPGLILLALSGCAQDEEVVVTGSTAQEMRVSIRSISRTLPPDRRAEFQNAIEAIVFSATDRGLAEDGERLTPHAMQRLRGRSVYQVIEDAKLLRAAGRY